MESLLFELRGPQRQLISSGDFTERETLNRTSSQDHMSATVHGLDPADLLQQRGTRRLVNVDVVGSDGRHQQRDDPRRGAQLALNFETSPEARLSL